MSPFTFRQYTDLVDVIIAANLPSTGQLQGFFYPSGFSARLKIPVPVAHDFLNIETIADLATDAWMSSELPDFVDRDLTVKHAFITKFPSVDGEGVPLRNPFTIIFYDQGQLCLSRNRSLRPIVRGTNVDWRGSILVLKHGVRQPLVHVTREDGALVDMILSSAITLHQLR